MTLPTALQTSGSSCPIVGIGASAGGLEAFRQLLEHVPVETGLGFVLVQHLDPTHESILTELLSRATSIPVSEVRDGTLVEPDHVYVIPPNMNLTIAGGVLKLLPRQQGRGQHRPIDDFFRSLAEDQRNRAIGVILSGTASDGTHGLEAIKAEGGITFAQEEQSAKYASMPHSAIAAGCVDFILPPEGIAQELARIGRHPYVLPSPAAIPATSTPEDGTHVEQIQLLLRQAAGVDFTKYKANTFGRRIKRRMVLQRMDGLDQYVRYLQDNPAEVAALYKDLLIGVTGFFRNPDAFQALKNEIFPELTKHRSAGEPLRVWVCGCSTGEEAYSIAMAFLEFAEALPTPVPLQVFATDLNERAIEQARRGRYPKAAAHDLPPERVRRFFAEADGGYLISKPVRDLCIFARHNVLTDPPFSRVDLVSCRNLLIYLEPVLQRKVLSVLHYALNPTGFLWLGASESIGRFSNLFAPHDTKHRIYSKKPAAVQPILHGAGEGRPPALVSEGQATGIVGERIASSFNPLHEADRLILARYAPAAVLINAEMEILHTRGDTSPYLQLPPGKATLNLLRLARADSSGALRTAIHQARKEQGRVRKAGLAATSAGQPGAVNLEVVPITDTSARERYFLVLFEPASPPPSPDATTTTAAAAEGGRARRGAAQREIVRLRQELAATRDHLESVIEQHEAAIEELQSAGEEIQSSNEELQSINEELETAKEELESSNEELTTINEELGSRNLELNQLNNDLLNLLSSVNIAIVMVGSDLRIRRFTPVAASLLNLIAADIGRPISDIKPNVNLNLARLIVEAVDGISVQEREVQDEHGRWYHLYVRPYKTLDNKIDGAVVVLVDIDAIKQSQQRIQDARDYAEAIVATVPEPLLVLDGNLRVQTASRSFLESFRVGREETEACFIYELGSGQWNIPELRRLLTDVLPKNRHVEGFEVSHDFPGIGQKTMLLNARRLDQDGGRAQLILLAMEDISERKRAEEERARLLASEHAAREAAETAVRLRDEFLSVASHELRTPLTTVSAQAQLALRQLQRAGELDRARLLHSFEAIRHQTNTLARLIEQLLNMSRLEGGKLTLEQEVADLKPLVESVAQGARARTERHVITVKSPRSVRALVDPLRLEQVLSNLVDNSIKYSPDGGPIEIVASKPARGLVEIAVRDYGVGIPPEKRGRIFERFYQAHGGKHSIGLGLGLYVSHQIVELHGGDLRAEFPEDGGSRFIVRLPLRRATSKRPAKIDAEQPQR